MVFFKVTISALSDKSRTKGTLAHGIKLTKFGGPSALRHRLSCQPCHLFSVLMTDTKVFSLIHVGVSFI